MSANCADCAEREANGRPSDLEVIVGRLDRHSELLAELANVLAPKRFRLSQMAVEDGTGHAAAIYPVTPGGANLLWLIERWTQSSNSGGNPQCGIYVMDSKPPATNVQLDDLYLSDYTNVVKGVADLFRPIVAKGGEVVIVQWTGLTAGAICRSRLQYMQAWQGQD